MTRVALLGTGYIGRTLIGYLKKRGLTVRASTTTPAKVQDLEKIADEVYLLKRDELNKIEQFLTDCDALVVTVAPKDCSDYQTTYLDTAQTIRDIKLKLKCLIYTSSTSVYGDHNGGWVDEENEPLPESSQGGVLLDTESIYLKGLSTETRVCVLRLGGIYGPGREIINRLKRSIGKRIPGNGLNYTNLIHRDDVISAIAWSLDQKLAGVYNLVNDTHVTRKELYSELAHLNQLPEVLWDETIASPHTGNKRVSNTKFKLTGFQFTHPSYTHRE